MKNRGDVKKEEENNEMDSGGADIGVVPLLRQIRIGLLRSDTGLAMSPVSNVSILCFRCEIAGD